MGRISFPKGRGSQMHNRRDYERYGRPLPNNINQNRICENVTLVDVELKDAYQQIFGDALEKYNSKQKRADRKIGDYMDHVKKSKNGEQLFYEHVLQWGTKEDFEKNPELREVAKQCLIEYVSDFAKENPQLKVIGAYIHMDEASPHLHIDYIPVAIGYKRGMSTRNSLDKALKQMGFTPSGKEGKQNNATMVWKEKQRSKFKQICLSHGLEVEKEEKWGRKSLSPNEYKHIKDCARAAVSNEIQEELDAVAPTELKKSVVGDYYKGDEVRALEDECSLLKKKNMLLTDENKDLKSELSRKQYVQIDELESEVDSLKGKNMMLNWQLDQSADLEKQNSILIDILADILHRIPKFQQEVLNKLKSTDLYQSIRTSINNRQNATVNRKNLVNKNKVRNIDKQR